MDIKTAKRSDMILSQFIDAIQLGAITNTDTTVTIPSSLARHLLARHQLLTNIERKLCATPQGVLLLEAERAGIPELPK